MEGALEARVRREVRTELLRRDHGASFVVRTESGLWQERIVKMGWQPQRAGAFERWVDDTPILDAVFDRFARHLPLMLLQSSRQVEPDWRTGLHAFAERMEGSGVFWWLYGSAALAVRGIDVAPGDVDLAVDDAQLAAEAMEPLLVLPVTYMPRWVADWTAWSFAGAIVEWLQGCHPTGSSPPHEQEPAIIDSLEEVSWEGRQVLIPPISSQLVVIEARGLMERAAAIRQHLDAG